MREPIWLLGCNTEDVIVVGGSRSEPEARQAGRLGGLKTLPAVPLDWREHMHSTSGMNPAQLERRYGAATARKLMESPNHVVQAFSGGHRP